MAAADTEMTIILRARDEVTKVVRGVSGGLRSAFSGPLGFIGKEVGGLLKQLFSLKSLLLGGGVLALFSRGLQGVAKDAEKFEAAFSPEQQQQINAVASAWSKLGAAIQSVFGRILAEHSEEIIKLFTDIGLWVTRNKDNIVEFFRALADAVQFFAKIVVNAALFLKSVFQPIFDFLGISAKRIRDLLREQAEANQQATTPPEELEAFNRLVQARKADANATKEQTAAQRELNQVTVEYLIQMREVAQLFADRITDGFFAVIEGTKSVADAFREMVGNILKELGRLLIQRALFNLFSSLLGGGGLFGIGGGGGGGGAGGILGGVVSAVTGGGGGGGGVAAPVTGGGGGIFGGG